MKLTTNRDVLEAALIHFDRHIHKLTGDWDPKYRDHPDYWVCDYDSGPGMMGRAVIFGINDDGYFVTMVVKLDLDELKAIAYIGDDDETFQPITLED